MNEQQQQKIKNLTKYANNVNKLKKKWYTISIFN